MPRRARIVVPGLPHHVTQRGNRRQGVFRDERDRVDFTECLAKAAANAGVHIWAYALMTNHIHLIAVPETLESLAAMMRDCPCTYALKFNAKYEYTGHLWQGRFYSSVLDREHLWKAVRYVERNPVRAGIIEHAEEYPWSSAAFHCGLRRTDSLISPSSPLVGAIVDWSGWLSNSDADRDTETLRQNTRTGRASGSSDFVQTLEAMLGRPIAARLRGPDRQPRKRTKRTP